VREWDGRAGEPTAVTDERRHDRVEELYRRHVPDAVRLAYLLTGDATSAEDLAHEAFVRVIGRLAHVRNAEAFGAYLRRAVVNLAISHHRRRTLERRFMAREQGMRPPLHGEPDVELAETMRRALERLPASQRAAVILRFYEDLSEAAVAEILRCRPGTVRSRVARAMETLRAEFAPSFERVR
jgi:RNA polymerase sigma-70 factor (sigma-E family)